MSKNAKECNELSPAAAVRCLFTAQLAQSVQGTDGLSETTGRVLTDSRRIKPGDIFLAYRGVSQDGHQFVAKAIEAGAALVVGEDPAALKAAPAHVLVDNGREAWAWLCSEAAGHPQNKLCMLAVTGTNGKTSTTWMAARLLQAMGHTAMNLGTVGAFVGSDELSTSHTTPDPPELYGLLKYGLEKGAKYACMEASSHAVRQKKMAPIRFDAAAWTSFSRDHLDFHSSMEDYWQAKHELFTEYLKEDGQAYFNALVAPRPSLQPPRRASLYQAVHTGDRAHIDNQILAQVGLTHAKGTDISLQIDGDAVTGTAPFFGIPALENFTAALMLVRSATGNLPAADIWQRIPAVPGRFELIQQPQDFGPRVFVDYAHTPDAVEKALATLRPITNDELWVVVGCGGDRDRGKRPEMAAAAVAGADRVVLTSDNPRTEDPRSILDDMIRGLEKNKAVECVLDRRQAIRETIQKASPNDTVLIAGKGHETYQIIGQSKLDFDDRVEAKLALKQRGS